MADTVNKAASSQEIQAIVGNIIGLLEELKTMEGQMDGMDQAPMEEGMEMKQENETDRPPMEEEELEKTEKGLEQTNSDGSTANDDAGVRDEENLTVLTEESVDEVAKALLHLVKQKKKTEKSKVTNSNDNIMPVLQQLNKTLKSMSERQKESENAIEGILEGLGVAKAIENETTQKVEKSNPAIRSEKSGQEILAYIAKALGENRQVEKEEDEYKNYAGNINQSARARKSISNFLKSGAIQGDK